MSTIQPIYIYKFDYYVNKSTSHDTLRYKYFILDSKIVNPEDKVHCFYRIDSLNAILFINKKIHDDFDFKLTSSWWELKGMVKRDNKCYLNSNYFYLIDFSELLELLDYVGKSPDKSWDLSEVVSLLQLIIANWEDWYQ